MNETLSFRKFQIENYDTLISLWEASNLPFKPKGRDSRENINKEIIKDDTRFLFCEMDGKIVGVILITDDGRKGWINRLAVLPQYRHAGIATRIIKEAERILIEKGLGIITCLIEEDNLNSRELFMDLGYVEHKEIIYYAKRIKQDI